MRALGVAIVALATAALIAACGGSAGRIAPTSAATLNADLTNIQAAVLQQDCTVTDGEIQLTRSDFATLLTSVDAALRNELVTGLNVLAASARQQCQPSNTGPTGPTSQTGPTGASSTTGSTGTTSTTGATSSTSSTSATSSTSTSATTTSTTSSTASSTATTTTPASTGASGATCTTTGNGGTQVCEGATGTGNLGGGIGGPAN